MISPESRAVLCSVPTNVGRGANDGAYYPLGLVTIANHLARVMPSLNISVVDLHHQPDYEPQADVVGISASSTLNYRNVLRLAQKAKAYGATIVVGGPHATQLAEQILVRRKGLIDYVIRGNGEYAFASLLSSLSSSGDLTGVPSLSWRTSSGNIIHNNPRPRLWRYDDFTPIDLSVLSDGITPYWNAFRASIDQAVDAAFLVFTHFGCGYRELMKARMHTGHQLSAWCSYCSLNDELAARTGKNIVRETIGLLQSCNVPKGAKVLLKCYGDNVGIQTRMLTELADAIRSSEEWHEYDIGWTFYCQSSLLTPKVAELLSKVGTRNVYIGFDSGDDDIQRLNGLGTSLKAHWRAIELCEIFNLKIQAGFVLGCAGETEQTLDNTIDFAKELKERGVLERINSAVLFVIPGSPAYTMLCEREPWIRELDELSTTEVRQHWVRHFCPRLGAPEHAVERLRAAADQLDELSPGPHASMGFVSKRLAAKCGREPVEA